MKSLILVCLCTTAVFAAPWPNAQEPQLQEQQNRRRLQSLSVKLVNDRDDDDRYNIRYDDRDREENRRDREDRNRGEDRRDREDRRDYKRDDRRDDRREDRRDDRREDKRDDRREDIRNREYRDRIDRDTEYRGNDRRYDDRQEDREDDREDNGYDREDNGYDREDNRFDREDNGYDREDNGYDREDNGYDREDDESSDLNNRYDDDSQDEQHALRSSHLDALARQMDFVSRNYGSQGRVRVAYIPPTQTSSLLYRDLGSLNFRYTPSRSREQVQYQQAVFNRPVLYVPRPSDDALSYNQLISAPLRRPRYLARDDDYDDDQPEI